MKKTCPCPDPMCTYGRATMKLSADALQLLMILQEPGRRSVLHDDRLNRHSSAQLRALWQQLRNAELVTDDQVSWTLSDLGSAPTRRLGFTTIGSSPGMWEQ